MTTQTTDTRYGAATDALRARGITVASGPMEITMIASQVRQSGPGRPYVDHHVAGISRSAVIHPRVSDAAQRATMTLSAPETEAERAALLARIIDHIAAHHGIGGSAYDPIHAAAWAAHRTLLAALRG